MIFVGIDPGTTVGWAVLDLKGNVKAVGAEKELDVNTLIAKLHTFGSVAFVGTDKAKVPSFVQEVATKLGAETVAPKSDLLVEEKRSATQQFSFKNAHEQDALASALVAFKHAKPLFSRIHSYLAREKRTDLLKEVFRIISKQGISIHGAYEQLTQKPIVEITPEIKEANPPSPLAQAKKDNALLRKQNEALRSELGTIHARMRKLEERMATLVKPKTKDTITKKHQQQVEGLFEKIKLAKKQNKRAKEQVKLLEQAIMDQNTIALPRIPSLGWHDVSKRNFPEGSIVFVDNFSKISPRSIDLLKEKGVSIILSSRKPKTKLPFALINCTPKKTSSLALINKEWLEQERRSKFVFERVITEYKKERALAHELFEFVE